MRDYGHIVHKMITKSSNHGDEISDCEVLLRYVTSLTQWGIIIITGYGVRAGNNGT